VRWHVRKRYAIVTTKRSDYSIGGCAPHLCTMQLLRHTGDYDTYSGQWFTAVRVICYVSTICSQRCSFFCSCQSVSKQFLSSL
jgi:hypothetical protein